MYTILFVDGKQKEEGRKGNAGGYVSRTPHPQHITVTEIFLHSVKLGYYILDVALSRSRNAMPQNTKCTPNRQIGLYGLNTTYVFTILRVN